MHKDIDFIINDLKSNHQERSNSIQKNSSVNQKGLAKTVNFKDSCTEQLLIILYK